MVIVLHEQAVDYEREYQRVRAALVAQGTSLNAWLAARNIDRYLASKALRGLTFGRKAVALRSMILREVLAPAEEV